MTVIELVMKRLHIPSRAALARMLGLTRTAPAEWARRLNGNIPTKHWPALVDEAQKKSVSLTYEELRGK